MFRCFKQYLSFDSFHKSQLPFKVIMKLMAIFSLIFAVVFFILKDINNIYSIKLTATANLIDFLCLELLPMIFLCGLMGVKYHYKKSHLDTMQKFFKHFWTWCKIFVHDVVHHLVFILLFILLLWIVQNVVDGVLPTLFHQGMATSQNTRNIAKLGNANGWFLVSTIIIAPIAEEFFFRLCCTTAFEHFIGLFGRVFAFFYHLGEGQHIKFFKLSLNKYYVKFCYVVGAILSALVFGLLHDPMDPSIFLLLDYVSMALIFQYLMHRTHSLTASVSIHGALNLLVCLPILISIF